MRKYVLLVFGILTIINCSSTNKIQETKGPYLGEKPPGRVAKIFAPGIISDGMNNRDIAITPDGKEIYYCSSFGNFSYSKIFYVRQLDDGSWTTPEIASFCSSGEYYDIEPFISHDGEQLYFMSTRPDIKKGETKGGDQDIWVVDRVGDSWGTPYNLGEPVSSSMEEYFPSLTKDGTIYFTRQKNGDPVGVIYRSKLVDGKYSEPEKLPEQVNCGSNRFNAYVAPDESYVIVPAVWPEKSLGGIDYFITYRNEKDEWSDPILIENSVSTESDREYSAALSTDGKYLFFMSDRMEKRTEKLSYSDYRELFNSPGNGYTDIYWISSRIIDELRPAGF